MVSYRFFSGRATAIYSKRRTGINNFMVNENIRSNVEISKDHPRYRSLVVREHMGRMVERGIVAQTGLIAHGRGEAFDYLIGERTTGPGERAERAAVAVLLEIGRAHV